MLLLDEATAALDAESEQAVQDALRELRRGRTTFIVAHRLNTVREADRILVVVDGQVVGSGRHEELLRTCPAYSQQVRQQMGDEAHAAALAEIVQPATALEQRDAGTSTVQDGRPERAA